MNNRFFTLFFLLILCASASAQTARIKRILDSNLFETFDGRIIKLAGIDIPSQNHPDRYLRGVAERAMIYARSVFLNRTFNVNPLSLQDSSKSYELVIIQKDFPLGLLDYNKEYLSQGFGRFTGDVPKAYYNEYRDAEQDALANERGVWKVVKAGSTEVLDREFNPEEVNFYVQKDSLISLRHPRMRHESTAGIVVGELFFGPLGGFLAAVPGAYMFVGLSNISKKTPDIDVLWAFIGAGMGYIAGTGIGVYLTAHADNTNVSLIETISASFLGAGGGIGIAFLLNRPHSSAPFIVALAGPLIGSMVYSNFMVPRPVFKDYYSSTAENYSPALSYSHKDLYNSTVLYNMNLLTISF